MNEDRAGLELWKLGIQFPAIQKSFSSCVPLVTLCSTVYTSITNVNNEEDCCHTAHPAVKGGVGFIAKAFHFPASLTFQSVNE